MPLEPREMGELLEGRGGAAEMPNHLRCINGWYHFRATIRKVPVQKSLGTRDKALAKRLARILFEEYKLGIRKAGKPVTCAQFLEVWLRESVAARRQEKQVRDARAKWEKWGTDLLPMAVDAVTPADISALRIRLDASPLAPRTVRHVLIEVGALFRFAVKREIIDRSPFDNEVLPKIHQRKRKRLFDIEAARVMDAAKRVPDHDPGKYFAPLFLKLDVGFRWGELRRLAPRDVEFDHHRVAVEKTKNKKVRYLPLTPKAERVLRDAIEAAGKGAVRIFSLPRSAQHIAKQIRRASGVVQFTVHQLRHTFASRFLEAGGSLEALRQLLGHSTLQMVLEYAQPDTEWLAEQMEAVKGRQTALEGSLG